MKLPCFGRGGEGLGGEGRGGELRATPKRKRRAWGRGWGGGKGHCKANFLFLPFPSPFPLQKAPSHHLQIFWRSYFCNTRNRLWILDFERESIAGEVKQISKNQTNTKTHLQILNTFTLFYCLIGLTE